MREKRGRLLLAGALLWLAVNVLLGAMAYRSYQEKAELLCLVMEPSDEERLERVTQYLKGAYLPEAGEGYAQLGALGFTQRYPDLLKRWFFRDLCQQLAVTSVLFGLCAAGFEIIQYRGRQRREREEQELCAVVEDIRSGKYELLKEIGDNAEEFWFRESSGDEGLVRVWMSMTSLAEQVRLMTEEAAREKEETKKLVTDLSHQLRTPMMALKASFDILVSKELEGEEYDEFLRRCTDQIQRLTELTDSLLQISRMETGLIEVRPEPAPLFDTILLAVNRIYPRASKKGIEIILEESADRAEDQLIEQDQKWLAEAIINVLENAVKYSDSGTSIRIRVQRMAVSMRLEIEDEGVGVPAGERSRIFQRFYRGSGSRIREESGQGIGLYLTRQIIEKHGGTIKVMPALPRGSRFVIQLPMPEQRSLTEM
ncbi:MAG: HAMP domain-containing sensor histidine kinase [Lachnospiraceae bacterium]|nr:HAMP domain-containing sensor histidine kinase [Lachnospiraceae bacterium]